MTAAWLGAALLLFASIYLGVGFTEVVIQFPGALETTHAANFPERFGDPVRRAVAYFAVQSTLMVAGGVALTLDQWDAGGRRLGPLLYLVMTVVATAFTVVFILPVNRALYKEISDEVRFKQLLTRWVHLNIARAAMWAVEWLAIAGWFVAVAGGGS